MMTETLKEYIQRTAFMDWKPGEDVFLPHPQVGQKVNDDGSFRPFWGDTMLFYLNSDAVEGLSAAQQILYDSGMPLSDRLGPERFHMTLHDLDHTMGCERRWDATKQRAESILRTLDDGVVRLTPVSAFPMMNTSIVMGYRPREEEDCRRLMEWHHAFEPLFSYGQPTFHVTLAYFRPGLKGQMDMPVLERVLGVINRMPLPGLTLSGSDLVYQRFYDMDRYF